MKYTLIIIAALALLVGVGCGRSAEEQAEADAQQQSEWATQNAMLEAQIASSRSHIPVEIRRNCSVRV